MIRMRNAGRLGLAAALLVWSLLPKQAAAATCPSPDQLKVADVARSFEEQRFLSGMKAPLESQGRLTIQGETIHWHMTEPFDVETILAPDGITQSVDGAPAEPVGPGGAQIGAAIAQAIGDLMQGQWSRLQALFEIAKPASDASGDWIVTLHPIDTNLQKILDRIEVQGCTDITEVRVGHPNGDREVIRFKEQ